MQAIVRDAMKQGAFGVSTGLIYPPNAYADIEELTTLSRVAAQAGGLYASHLRYDGPKYKEGIEEIIGMPLFERRKTGYVATVAGAEMAALASRMDEDVTAFARRLAGSGFYGPFRVRDGEAVIEDRARHPMMLAFQVVGPANAREAAEIACRALNLLCGFEAAPTEHGPMADAAE